MEGNIAVAVVEHEGQRYIKAIAQLTETSLVVFNRRHQELFRVEAPQVIQGSAYLFGSTKVEASGLCGCGHTRVEGIETDFDRELLGLAPLDPNR